MVFGCLHLIPIWTSPFPSDTEKILWIISAFVITIELTLIFLGTIIWLKCIVDTISFLFYALVHILCPFVYVVARLILIILAFTALRKVPQGAYQIITWPTSLPHV
ncbi:hypothetical protein P691DRAFT_672033 [Macrolepiota fuliginosa MF-IS2]|uniref:Uncharacterized protein n=1 Tax=Macrolepiota fuliginosa MF-IS2 TaxID=1400762 RepID=A0A9P5X9H7_9AGAR|nr:hypothetical protein P691DRAFT_672033 [Macrolepiota fuliginosa MF-IS2]